MSRKTSDEHDRLSEQDGYRGPQAGKRTDFNPPEPVFALDYDSAAAGLPEQQRQGLKRYAQLMADGGEVARGATANKYGFNTGRDYSEYGGGGGVGGDYAVILRPEGNGIGIWQVRSVSADAFQTAARGKASGLTDDGPTGYLFYEDRRNPRYSIALYEQVGIIPDKKVYEAEKAGLVQSSMATRFRDKSPIWQIEEIRRKAEEDARLKAALPTPPTPPVTARKLIAIEMTVLDMGDGTNEIFVAKTGAESSGGDSPHPGVQVAGLDFVLYSGGKLPKDFGMSKPILTIDDDGTIRPADEEFESIKQEAAAGSLKAQRALYYAGLGPAPKEPFLGGLFG